MFVHAHVHMPTFKSKSQLAFCSSKVQIVPQLWKLFSCSRLNSHTTIHYLNYKNNGFAQSKTTPRLIWTFRGWEEEICVVPKVNAVGGSKAAKDLPWIACPPLARKKMYRGIIAPKCIKGATIAASLAFEKKTDKKKPVRKIQRCYYNCWKWVHSTILRLAIWKCLIWM